MADRINILTSSWSRFCDLQEPDVRFCFLRGSCGHLRCICYQIMSDEEIQKDEIWFYSQECLIYIESGAG